MLYPHGVSLIRGLADSVHTLVPRISFIMGNPAQSPRGIQVGRPGLWAGKCPEVSDVRPTSGPVPSYTSPRSKGQPKEYRRFPTRGQASGREPSLSVPYCETRVW